MRKSSIINWMSPETSGIRIRTFEQADIPFALIQTGREGWDPTTESFRMLLAHDPDGSFIAEVDGVRAGMITTTCYSESGWIGNLIVPPEFRKRAIGSVLMERGIAHIEQKGVGCLRLEADPLGINIYRRLGFVDEFDSPRFRITDYNFRPSTYVRELSPGDLQAVSELDLELFGDDRSRLLRMLLADVVAAYRVPRSGRLEGYLFVQHSTAGCRLGPWVARDPAAAHELLTTALANTGQRPVILAIPGVNMEGAQLLSNFGFYRTPSSLRMLRGSMAARGQPQCVYALAGGAIG